MAWGKQQALRMALRTSNGAMAGNGIMFRILIEELQICCTLYLTYLRMNKFSGLKESFLTTKLFAGDLSSAVQGSIS